MGWGKERFTIRGKIERETEKAIKVITAALPSRGHHEVEVRIWIPKQISTIKKRDDSEFEIELPLWFIDKKNKEFSEKGTNFLKLDVWDGEHPVLY